VSTKSLGPGLVQFFQKDLGFTLLTQNPNCKVFQDTTILKTKDIYIAFYSVVPCDIAA